MKSQDEPALPAVPASKSSPALGVRLYVHEPGWQIGVKRGSDRVFCHMMAPGQDYYHRLMDGELYLHQDSERLCLACAGSRGILSYEPRRLPDEAPKFLTGARDIPPLPLGDERK